MDFQSVLDVEVQMSQWMRMRHKVVTLLQVLNRAVPDKDPTKVQKKTMAGKTFTRR